MNKRLFSQLIIIAALFLRAAIGFADDISITPDSGWATYKETKKFLPLDTAPRFEDFQTVLQWRASDFSTWIFPPLVNDSFTELNETTALSDHYVTWGEMALFFTSIGGWFQLQEFVTQNAFDHFSKEASNHVLQKEDGTYEVKEGFANQPARLPLTVLRCYANGREVRYWLHQQLRAQEAACQKGIEVDAIPGELTTYFTMQKQQLWPIVDIVHGTDHLSEIMAQGIKVGTYWFSEDGKKEAQVSDKSDQSSYRLATSEEVAAWQISHGDHSEMASLEQEGYGLFAINTTEMKNQPGFKEHEEKEDLARPQETRITKLTTKKKEEIGKVVLQAIEVASVVTVVGIVIFSSPELSAFLPTLFGGLTGEIVAPPVIVGEAVGTPGIIANAELLVELEVVQARTWGGFVQETFNTSKGVVNRLTRQLDLYGGFDPVN